MTDLQTIPGEAAPTPESLKPALETLLAHAKSYGASAANALALHGRSLSVGVREGALEDVDNSENKDIGLTVFVGQRQASVSSSDFSKGSLQSLAERAVAMAKLAPEDPYCGLSDVDLRAGKSLDLDVYDVQAIPAESLFTRAQELDKIVRGVDGIAQADGASAYASGSALYFMTSDGFARGRRGSRHGLSVSAIAEKDGAMERDYDYIGARWFADLPPPESVALKAAHQALARVGSQKIKSGSMPVLFDSRAAASLISPFLSAISGPSIARGNSFLKTAMDTDVFAKSITITDDPLRRRGLGSRPWDGEGVKVQARNLIDNGRLTTWLLHTSSARQLGLASTGHAAQNPGAPPSVSASNVYVQNGEKTPAKLMADIGNGLLVSEMFGPSLNGNTGDFSVGIAGFEIKNGQRGAPVSEITVAGNLKDMFKSLTAANDLEFKNQINSPTLLVDSMVVAGA